MQQEDDLRGLAKTMDFMRALSILFVVINIYWFCYGQIREWGINIGVVDRILLNFDRTAGCSGIYYGRNFFRRRVPRPFMPRDKRSKKRRKLPGGKSRHRWPREACCSSSTGGCWTCR